jgi:predicted lipase|tara:strand:- start:42 stop:401 length:360 start_codon:yes stop_codon:yes gene_type:complete
LKGELKMVTYKFDCTDGVGKLIFNHLKEGCKNIEINGDYVSAMLSFEMALNLIKFTGLGYFENSMEKVENSELKEDEEARLFETADPPYALFRFDESKVEEYGDRNVISDYVSRRTKLR